MELTTGQMRIGMIIMGAALVVVGVVLLVRALRPAPRPLRPLYDGLLEPRFPCHLQPTRHCPAVYEDVCGVRPCARFESRDENPWRPEVEGVQR